MVELPPDPPERGGDDDPPDWDMVVSLYRDLQTAARRAAAWILGSPLDSEIEDVIHDAIVKAARALPALRHSDRVHNWFLKIVICTARDRRRARSRRSRRESPVGSVGNLEQVYCASARGLLPGDFPLLCAGLEFINTLPEKQRMAYLLEHFFGLDREDIAEVLGCSPRTVGTHLRRAQAKAVKKFPPAADLAKEAQQDQPRRSTA
jgi:RNA polymerase sigma-70 factor, ECF subfamily